MLNINDLAPDFSALDNSGNTMTLKGLLSDCDRLVLYFYPKDNTPGCTAEACSLRDGYSELLKQKFKVIGVSPDTAASHNKFIEKQNLPFPLIADTDHALATAYEAWGKKKFMGREYMGILRKTYIIDSNGKISKIFDKVDTKDHFNQILNSYK